MTLRPGRCACVLALVLLLASVAGADTTRAGVGLAATRALVARLSALGRGEAAITVTQGDPMGGPDRVQAGRIALEPPDRVRLDFAGGERLALRGEAGEWIQPQAEQMVRLGPGQAGMAAWLWEVLIQGGTGGFRERRLSPRRLVLVPRDPEAGLPDSITVGLDARGYPALIEFAEVQGAATRYRFKEWRFTRARGPAAFTLTAPRGFTVVEIP